ncbi:GNAT family N-acetyltransferase [Streptomyces sp. TS71-3]|uniref:GNAT family N-acetyltransferase n=1 Tax=Streptomyces sp. TS71-3 TaxID=2733862 RepID=UPI001B296FC0|nr:GNAT family N-acetyltransferase [Streptomyces sp. TS71-3]GHJ41261.1 N-acetyltransferase [Streptomyces sp. TS71-3]
MTATPTRGPAPAHGACTIRRARTAEDLEGARKAVLHTAEVDLGYGYQPEWHWDLDHPVETYVDNPRQAMFVAVTADEDVAACAAVRIGGPKSPPHAPELAARYADRQAVAQLLRVATLPGYRRAGLARRLVAACQGFVRADGGFRVIYLHTNTLVPAAEPFWRSLPVVEVRDDRPTETDPRFSTVHFELPLDAAVD